MPAPSTRGPRTAFDAYLVVDWSGSRKPRRGPNSIWWTLLEWRAGKPIRTHLENSPTRSQATAEIREALVALSGLGRSVLVGFDFPYGFPSGTCAGLLGRRPPLPCWRALWDELADRVHDGEDNQNDRFEVAAALNLRLSGTTSPFWGWDASRGAPPPGLGARKPLARPAGLAELRVTDRRIRGPKSAFQLWGNGSVGSQALLGIPRVRTLLDDPALSPHSSVWPFTTGPRLPPRGDGPRIVYAEVYPSMVDVTPRKTECKDEAQVQALARYFATEDTEGRLATFLEAPAGQPPAVLEEEGWILGAP